MRYHILAVDYDGTLALNGRVDEYTLIAMKKFLATGRRLMMVTGRELPDLLTVCPHTELFELIVAENGGLLYRPSTKEERLLTDPPSEELVKTLKARGVGPISVGKSIIATWHPHETTVLEAIRDLGLDLQVIFNKGAVMILPAGVNKASGFAAALKEMGYSEHNVVGIGDAENDHAFLRKCELAAAVANALPAVKETADYVTKADHGHGVSELMELIVGNDLADFESKLTRHDFALGKNAQEKEYLLPAHGPNVLICGPSESGKSSVAKRVVEAMMEQEYQFCLIDPEGDYEKFEGAEVLGNPNSHPQPEEITHLLENPTANAVVCLTGMTIPDRPPFFLKLVSQLLHSRTQSGHPHWLVLDEAHHLVPAEWVPQAGIVPDQLYNTVLITVDPALLSSTLLERVNIVLAVGADACDTLQKFAKASNRKPLKCDPIELEKGEVLAWRCDSKAKPEVFRVYPHKMLHHRHRRKYAQGALSPEDSFYFRGPEGKLNLRAQNLFSFLELADGIDDDTWEHHLQNGDYSKWFSQQIKDPALAEAAAKISDTPNLSAKLSRQAIRKAIEENYTLPATAPLPVAGAR